MDQQVHYPREWIPKDNTLLQEKVRCGGGKASIFKERKEVVEFITYVNLEKAPW